MSNLFLRGLLPAFVIVALLGFVAGCSTTQGGYGTTPRGDDTTSMGTGTDNTGMGGTDTRAGGTNTGTGSGTTGTGSSTGSDNTGMSGRSESMSGDAMALSMMKAADEAEIEIVEFASDRVKDSRVKDYVTMLLKDHKNSLEKTEDLAKAQNVDLTSPKTDTTDRHVDNAKEQLRAAGEGNAFDTAFLQMSIEDHRANIDRAQSLQTQASSQQVREHFNAIIPKLQAHLDQARTLLNDLGGSQTGR